MTGEFVNPDHTTQTSEGSATQCEYPTRNLALAAKSGASDNSFTNIKNPRSNIADESRPTKTAAETAHHSQSANAGRESHT